MTCHIFAAVNERFPYSRKYDASPGSGVKKVNFAQSSEEMNPPGLTIGRRYGKLITWADPDRARRRCNLLEGPAGCLRSGGSHESSSG